MTPAWLNAPRCEEVPRELVAAWIADWSAVYPPAPRRVSWWARIRAWVYGGLV